MRARRNLLRAAVAAAVLTLAGLLPPGLASAQQKLVMKASDVHPLGYPTVEAVQNMGRKLEKATNGRLSIQMYA
jgi:TRAP-type C4-dicarboxylate transport system substrate-binding protein